MTTTGTGYTPLYKAVCDGDLPKVISLLKDTPEDVNIGRNKTLAGMCLNDNQTPLHIAAVDRRYDIVKVLIAAGADPNSKISDDCHTFLAGNRGATPLHFAVQGGCPEIVKCLLEAGADPDRTRANRQGEKVITPLLCLTDISSEESTKIITYLLLYGANFATLADINPEMYICVKGLMETAVTLLRADGHTATIEESIEES